jgi:hypothetical protein
MTTMLDVRRGLAALAATCACLILTACGGGGGGGSSTGSTGSTAASVASPSAPAAVQPTATISASTATVTAGQALTLTWNSQDTGATACTASGAWTGQVATSGSQQVTPDAQASTYTATYTITCGQASNSVAVTVAPPANAIPIVVDNGPAGAGGPFNAPFVSVTVCRPGTTVCQTIDHVLLDTGSYGLRLIAPLDGALALPTVTSSTGADVGECGQFVSGYTWGAIVQADIKLAGETAAAQSIQLIGQAPGGVATAPTSCSSTGSSMNTVATLGANGILGVGLFKEDCGEACASSAISATYYACASGTCTSTALALDKQVANPVGAFAGDNNGVVVSLPAVGASGATSLKGTLTFGIGTQPNNGLGTATRYVANSRGDFTTVYNGTTMTASFIDSGSNGLYFDDTSLPACTLSTDFYCPTSPQSLNATVMAYDGSASSIVAFTITDIDRLPRGTVAGWVGGQYDTKKRSGNAFDWGLPFFFGRPVYVGMATSTSRPYWAF